MMQGLEIIFIDGKKDWYDPLDVEKDIVDRPTHIKINHPNGYKYFIPKNLISKFRFYDLCGKCGNELIINHICK
jgi:hypothetical protein